MIFIRKNKLFFVICYLLFELSLSKLELVIDLSLHGQIYPENYIFKKDNRLKNELTNIGMRQNYILGKEIRNKYIEKYSFLSSNLKRNEIVIITSDKNKNLMSTLSHLYGLYPIGTGEIFSDDFPVNITIPPFQNLHIDINEFGNNVLPKRVQILSLQILDFSYDFILSTELKCPNFEKNQKKIKESLIYQKEFKERFYNDANEICDFFNKENLIENCDIEKIKDIRDSIIFDLLENRKNYTNDEKWKKILEITQNQNKLLNFEDTIQIKLLSTPILSKILDFIYNKVTDSNNNVKYVFFSVDPLLFNSILNIINNDFYEEFIFFSSQIILELHSSDLTTDYYLHIYYNGKLIKEISLKEFLYNIKPYVIENFDEICGINEIIYNNNINNNEEKKKNLRSNLYKILKNFNEGMTSSFI